MPSRIIREGLLDSDKYARISDASRLLFVHLMLLADDFGCVSVSAAFLRRRCFYDSPSDERIARLVCELVDVDLIRTYEIDRACLAFIPRFRQRLYLSKLKHPMPAESLYSDDADAVEKFNKFKKDSAKTPVVPPELPRDTPVVPPLELKRREVNTRAPLPAWVPEEPWQMYLGMRDKLRKSPTPRAIELLLAKLLKFKNDGCDVAAILEQSTMNSWTDLYAPKDAGKRKAGLVL